MDVRTFKTFQDLFSTTVAYNVLDFLCLDDHVSMAHVEPAREQVKRYNFILSPCSLFTPTWSYYPLYYAIFDSEFTPMRYYDFPEVKKSGCTLITYIADCASMGNLGAIKNLVSTVKNYKILIRSWKFISNCMMKSPTYLATRVIKCIEFFNSIGFDLPRDTMRYVIKNDNIVIMNYLIKNKLHVPYDSIVRACKARSYKCLRYLMTRHGIDECCDAYLWLAINARPDLLEKLYKTRHLRIQVTIPPTRKVMYIVYHKFYHGNGHECDGLIECLDFIIKKNIIPISDFADMIDVLEKIFVENIDFDYDAAHARVTSFIESHSA
jgi:hypothetical protein